MVIPGAPDNNDDDLPDISLTLRYSVNQSLEWIDHNGNGELDWYYLIDLTDTSGAEPVTDIEAIANQSDVIVDMGTRGLWPYVEDLDREYFTEAPTTSEPTTSMPTATPTMKSDDPEEPMSGANHYGIITICLAMWLNLCNMFM